MKYLQPDIFVHACFCYKLKNVCYVFSGTYILTIRPWFFFLKSDVKDEHVKMKSCCDIETEGSQLMLK